MITGANRGIGFSLAKELSEDMNNVIYATARDSLKAEALRSLGDNVKAIQLDVASPLETIKSQLLVLGDATIDVVFQNAGAYFDGGESSALTII